MNPKQYDLFPVVATRTTGKPGHLAYIVVSGGHVLLLTIIDQRQFVNRIKER